MHFTQFDSKEKHKQIFFEEFLKSAKKDAKITSDAKQNFWMPMNQKSAKIWDANMATLSGITDTVRRKVEAESCVGKKVVLLRFSESDNVLKSSMLFVNLP